MLQFVRYLKVTKLDFSAISLSVHVQFKCLFQLSASTHYFCDFILEIAEINARENMSP